MASETQAGRWAVVLAAVVGAFFLVQRLIADDSLWDSFIKGAAAAFAVMLLIGVGRRFWRGDKVESAEAPGGWKVSFARAALRPFRVLEERLDAQMKTVNDRIRAVEEDVRVLKESTPADEKQE
jgi:hypothetical protein